MMATLGGALVSDGLADGRVVSGVGGQYNFVAQAHALPGGRSLIAVRTVRDNAGRPESNIRFNYGHVTIPRHLRDIVLTEYGAADLRGKSDAEVAAAMLEIADSRFQAALLAETQRAGKLPASYRIPDACRANRPETLERALAPHRAAGFFGALPFGTDLTAEDLSLARALRRLKAGTQSLGGKSRRVGSAAASAEAAISRPRTHGPCAAPRHPRAPLATPSRLCSERGRIPLKRGRIPLPDGNRDESSIQTKVSDFSERLAPGVGNHREQKKAGRQPHRFVLVIVLAFLS